MNGIDVSFSRASAGWFVNRSLEGVKVFVQCLWTGGFLNNESLKSVAERNLRNAREAGLITAGYLNTNPWWSPTVSLTAAKNNAGAEWDKISIVFNDVELPGIDEGHIKAHCDAIEGAGKKTAIYSARWFWDGHLGNPTWPWLKQYKIWVADYDGDPNFSTALLFGPWTVGDIIGKQYRGTTDVEGVQVDFNNFDLSFFKAQEGPDDMRTSDEIYAEWNALKDGDFVTCCGGIVFMVERRGGADIPELVRVDDSKANIITWPAKPISPDIAGLFFHGRQIT
jgi:hypothetical protein